MTTLGSNNRRTRGSSGGPNKNLNKGPNSSDNSKFSSNFNPSNSSTFSATLSNQNSMPPGFDRRKQSAPTTNGTYNAWSRPNNLSTRLGSKDFGKNGSLIGNPDQQPKPNWSKEPTSPTLISRRPNGISQLNNNVPYTPNRHLQQNGSNLSYLQSKNVPAFISGTSTARFKSQNKPIQINNDEQPITQKKESMRLPQITQEQKNKIVEYLHLQMENFEASVRETGEIDIDAGIPLGYKGEEYKKMHPDKTNFIMSGKRMGGGFIFEMNEKIDKMEHMKGFKAIDITHHKMDLMIKKNKVTTKNIEDKTAVKVPLQVQKDKDGGMGLEGKKKEIGLKKQTSFGNPKSPKLSPTTTKPPLINAYKSNSQRDGRNKQAGPKVNITKGNSWSKNYSKNGNGKK